MEYLEFIFILAAVIQLYFLLMFFLKLTNYNNSGELNSSQNKLSIIVVFKDELKNLKNNLPHLLNQKGVDFELVLINDHSKDGSLEWLKSLDNPLVKVYSLKKERGKKKGIELALSKASNDNLLLTDADCKPTSNSWAIRMNSLLSNNTPIVLGYSRFYKKAGVLNLIQRYENFINGVQYLSFALKGKAYMGTGRNFAYTKSLRNKTVLPDSYFKIKSGDDDLFLNAIEKKKLFAISIEEESHTISAAASNWKEYFYQKRRHLEAGLKYRYMDKFRLAVLGLSQLLFNILFVLLLILDSNSYLILSTFVIKLIIQLVIQYKLSIKLCERGIWFLGWILEPLYLCLISIIGISVWLKKVDRWK